MGLMPRHIYDQYRVRRAMTHEWERWIERLEHDRDEWKARAEKAEQDLENHAVHHYAGNDPGVVPPD